MTDTERPPLEDVGKTALSAIKQTTNHIVTQFGGKDDAEGYIKAAFKSVVVQRQLPQTPVNILLRITIIAANNLLPKWREGNGIWRIYCTLDFQGSRRTTSGVAADTDVTFNEQASFPIASQRITAPLKISIWAAPTQCIQQGHKNHEGGGSDGRVRRGSFRLRQNSDARFLGQVHIKPADIMKMVSASGVAPLPLQKRGPRSTVKGCLAISVDTSLKETTRESSADFSQYTDAAAHKAAAKARQNFWPPPPPDTNLVTKIYYEACYFLMTYEAELMEVMPMEGEVSRTCSDGACYVLESLAKLPDCHAARIKMRIQQQIANETFEDNTNTGLPSQDTGALLVAWLTYLFKTHFHARGERLQPRLSSTNMADHHRRQLTSSLHSLVLYMQADLIQYKFTFAAHTHTVPPVFDHFLNTFVTAQAMLSALRTDEETPEQRVRRCIGTCKEKVMRLLCASVEAIPGVSAAMRLAAMADMVEEEIKYDLIYFAQYFRRHLGVDCLQLNAENLCPLHEAYMVDAIQDVMDSNDHRAVAIFEAFRKVRTIKEKYVDVAAWRSGQQVPYSNRHALFVSPIQAWLTDMISRVPGFVDRAIELDKFHPINQTTMHSTSVLDLMTILTQTLYELAELRWADMATGSLLFHLLAQMTVEMVLCYGDRLKKKFRKATRAGAAATTVTSSSTAGDATVGSQRISAALCVAINNLAQFQDCLDELQELSRRHLLSIHDAQEHELDLNSTARMEPAYADANDFDFNEEHISDLDASEYAHIEDVIVSDSDDDADMDKHSNFANTASAIDPQTSMRQTFQLALEQLSGCLSPLLSALTGTIFPVIDQYMAFVIGFRRAKPTFSKMVAIKHATSKTETTFAVSHVEGLDQRKFERVKKKMQRMARQSKRATWRRHHNKPANELVESQNKLRISTSAEQAALLSDAEVRISMEPLLDYLDTNLQILSANLYEDVFANVLAQIWDATLNSADNKVNSSQAHLDINQSASLFNFLRCLYSYFNADGNGIPPERLSTRSFDRLMDQLRLSRLTTSDIIWMYWEEQAKHELDIDNYDRASISFQVEYRITSGLHLDDKLVVRVKRCNHLPRMTTAGSTACVVDVTVKMGTENQVILSPGRISKPSLDPIINEEHIFDASGTLVGTIHFGVYHAVGQKREYIGEACYCLQEVGGTTVVDFTKPLGPMRSKTATALLSVLATRRGTLDAINFVQERAGEVRGRSSSKFHSKLHVVVGHHYYATHYAIPPECQICKSLIMGLGKKVYLCELCGTTVHKRCHFRSLPCPNSLSQSCV